MKKREARAGFAGPNPHGVLGGLVGTLGAGTVIQGIGTLAVFATLPILVNNLGTEVFGVLVVILSLGPWLVVADGAVYQATRIISGEQRSADGGRVSGSLLTSARSLAVRIMVVNSALLAIALAFLPLLPLFGAEGVLSRTELAASLALFSLPVILTAPGTAYLGALEGVGRTVAAAVISGLGPITVLPLTVVVAAAGGGLPWLSLVQGVGLAVPRIVAWGYWTHRPSVAASDVSGTPRRVRGRLIAQMTVLSVMGLAQTGLGPAIVSSQVGADGAASYGIVWRLVMGAMLPLVILTPLFTGSIAAARGQGWSRRSDAQLRRLLGQSVAVGALAGLCLVLFGPALTSLLSSGQVGASTGLFLAGAAFLVGSYASAPLAMAFSGPTAIRTAVRLNAGLTLINIALSFYLARRIGPAGPLWAAALSTGLATAFWLSMWWLRRHWLTQVHTDAPERELP